MLGAALVLVAVLGLLAATPSAAAAGPSPALPVDCPFAIPEGRRADCYHVIVPRNRAVGANPVLTLFVAVFRAPDPAPPDALVYLHGGPGGPAGLDRHFAPYWWAALDAYPWLGARDLVVLAERGAPPSLPALECQGFRTAVEASLARPRHDSFKARRAMAETLALCWETTFGRHLDVNAFSTFHAASDVPDVVASLGYDAWMLWGSSYGSRLALAVARQEPAGLRALVLEGTYPPQITRSAGPDFARNVFFDDVAAACARQAACAAAFPDPAGDIAGAIAAREEQPGTVEVLDPLSGRSVTLYVDGDVLRSTLLYAVYDHTLLADLPRAAHAAREGALDGLEPFLLSYLGIQRGDGMGNLFEWIFRCQEVVPFADPDDREFCAALDIRAVRPPAVRAVSSALPTLLLAGDLDWITPRAWAALAAKTLPNGRVVRLPGQGHSMNYRDPCLQALIAGFLDDPAAPLQDACLAGLQAPPFVVDP